MRTVVELAPRLHEPGPRAIGPQARQRYERYLAEILGALGMDLGTVGTRETPRRLLQALVDATAGYDGDPKLHAAFPSERPHGVEGSHSQIVEGPIAFYALCEHHALPFHGVAHVGYVAGPEILGISKADAARSAVRPQVHGAGAPRRAGGGHAGRARWRARRGRAARGRASLHAVARGRRGRLADADDVLARPLRRGC